MELGRLGVWASMDGMPAAAAADFARRVEGWGYDEHWAAGADHVCIQALNADEATPGRPDERLLAAIAPAGQPGH